MAVAYVLFYSGLFVLLYTYAGYGILIFIFNKIFNKKKLPGIKNHFPAVTLIVPAFNEAEWLQEKIENCLSLHYPGTVKILIITDGSTDDTPSILKNYPQLHWLHQPERKGKMAAINRSMQYVSTPIVVFTDANSLLNKDCLQHIVKHYANEKVGGVAGEKKIFSSVQPSGIAYTEGLYWQYESTLKQLDSDFNTVVGAAGELFSMRTELFQPQNENIILDDFMLSMKICIDGYKVVYEPNAFAIESASLNIEEERKRRVRIAAGAFQTIPLLWRYFLIVKKPLLYFQYFSRRILRWVACPVCLVLVYFSNAIIISDLPLASFFTYFFILQNVFYAIALAGGFWYRAGISLNVFFLPFYFVFMNALLVEGFIKNLSGKQTVLWEKSKRRLIHMHTDS